MVKLRCCQFPFIVSNVFQMLLGCCWASWPGGARKSHGPRVLGSLGSWGPRVPGGPRFAAAPAAALVLVQRLLMTSLHVSLHLLVSKVKVNLQQQIHPFTVHNGCTALECSCWKVAAPVQPAAAWDRQWMVRYMSHLHCTMYGSKSVVLFQHSTITPSLLPVH